MVYHMVTFMANLRTFQWKSHWDQKLELKEAPPLACQVNSHKFVYGVVGCA